MSEAPKCCYPDCPKDAEWQIFSEGSAQPSEGYTESCSHHVGYLLDDSSDSHIVYELGADTG